MKKIKVTAVLIVLVMLSLALVAPAAENVAPVSAQSVVSLSATEEVSSNKVTTIEDNMFYPMDVLLINHVTHTGSSAYTGEFTTAPENGFYLNVWVKNNVSSSVFINISRNGLHITDGYELKGKSQKTISFEDKQANGLSGDWEVYIYNKTGDKYNLNINARQF
ncbi:hypothetical protein MJ257_02880 [Paenibacillus timonensis]|uniref:DUF4352 domain-containing protein n=1 Tax=Paenibacillus timonensis TaxID=225915 RepID=A0ABW3S5T6_9BACL|nr:hypothetical protein [Paenibacillus timonensis]MCH1639037.1 hypothetical protein [Paenibacillus timonensis]